MVEKIFKELVLNLQLLIVELHVMLGFVASPDEITSLLKT